MIILAILYGLFSQIKAYQTKAKYINELKKIALSISSGDENLGESIRAERLFELVKLVGVNNLLDILIQMSKDKYPDVRMAVMECMGNTTKKDLRIERVLKEALKESLPGVRLTAAKALNKKTLFPQELDTVLINLALGVGSKEWSFDGYAPKKTIEKAKQEELNGTASKTGTDSSILSTFRRNIRRDAIFELVKLNTKGAQDALNALTSDSDPDIRTLTKEILNKKMS